MHRLIVVVMFLVPATAFAATLSVGPGQSYSRPSQAIAAAQPGDTIEVDAAGSYDGDHCAWATDNLTVRGVNGRARIDAGKVQANIANDKGIFAINAPNATIENFELSGAVADPSSNNGAGIRHQGTNLTVRNCFFHDNQDGILGSPPTNGTGTVDIENSEFANNGAGDGYSHNMYLGHYATFILNASYSHGAKVGHLVKSRAEQNIITYSRITDEPGTTASYELDLPNGGTSYIIGNLIEQDPQTQNPTIVAFAEEGATNADEHLFFVNNTVVNDLTKGTFLNDAATTPALVINNIFDGPGTVCSQGAAMLTSNFVSAQQGDPMLVNPSGFDYHLQAASPCIDKGTDPGSGMGRSLSPTAEYVSSEMSEPRAVVGVAIDIGAYELGNTGMVDAGSADAGNSPDGGGLGEDAGSSPLDAGAASDAGSSFMPANAGGGCATQSPGLGMLLLLAATLSRRRARCLLNGRR